MNKLIVASAACAVGLSLLAGVPAGNLPLPKDGLAVHLDASDTSTMTLDADGRVLEWRSKVGTVAFAKDATQNVTNLPYWKESINVPSTAKVPGVVFGLVPGFEYTSSAAGSNHVVRTWIKATESVASREVFLVMVNHCDSGGPGVPTVLGDSVYTWNGHFYQPGAGSKGDIGAMYGSAWSRGNVSADHYFGTTGFAWLNGGKVLDWPAGIYSTSGSMHGFSFAMNTLHVLDAVGDTTVSNEGIPTLGYSDTATPSMDVCELAVYSRVLTDEERAYVTRALTDKWKNKTGCIEWTGNGGDGKWTTAANWSGNAVPTASDTVAISSANVTVDADAACGYLAAVDVTVDIASETRLDVNLGAIYDVTITGEGTLKLADKTEMTVLPAGLTFGSGLVLQIGCGSTLDLNGKSISLASLTGGRPVTNTADAVATLTLGAACDGALDAALSGDIRLVKAGAETTVTVPAPQHVSSSAEIAGGTLRVSKELLVDAIPGCVLHVDASRRDTLEIDADNFVRSWRSTVDPADVFYTAETNEFMSASSRSSFQFLPTYLPTGINDRLPCVRFGYVDGTSTTGAKTILKLGAEKGEKTHTLKQRTVFFVDVPSISGNDTYVPYGQYFLGGDHNRRFSPVLSAPKGDGFYYNTSYSGTSPWGGGTNVIYVNGVKVVDTVAGLVPSRFEFTGASVPPRSNHPHVLTVTIPELTDDPPVTTFRPVLGGRCFLSYDDGGGCVGTSYQVKICEVIVFDRCLSDDERRQVETHLLTKWFDAAQFPEGIFERDEILFANRFDALKVTGDGAVDFNGLSQSFGSLEFDANGSVTAPCLTLTGDLDLSQTAFAMANGEATVKGPVVQTTGTLSGEFKSVEGVDAYHKLVYRAKDVIYKAIRGALLLVR